MEVLKYEDLDIDPLEKAAEPVTEWFIGELKTQGFDDAEDLVNTFTENAASAVKTAGIENSSTYQVEDHSDLKLAGNDLELYVFPRQKPVPGHRQDASLARLMDQATGGKVKVDVYAADQLTGGNQSEGIQALMNGDPVQISMHSNLIYSAFDPRFNVVSLPYLFDSVEDADAKLDGEAGQKMDEILSSYDLHCMGMAEKWFPSAHERRAPGSFRGRYEEPESACGWFKPSDEVLRAVGRRCDQHELVRDLHGIASRGR